MNKKSLFIAITVLCILPSLASAHPSDGLTPREPDVDYGTPRYGARASGSFGDVIFYAPYPSSDSLSNAEKYMLWGASNSYEGDTGRGPWWADVVSVAAAYYERNGELPSELTEEVIRSVAWQPNAVSMGALQWYKSPLTDNFPSLNSKEFSRGDLFLKVLDDHEIQMACESSRALNSVVNLGISLFPDGESGVEEREAELATPVFYVRVYGETEVIYSELFWQFKEK